MKRAVITRADEQSQAAAAEGTPWSVLTGTPTLRPGSAPMLLRIAATGVHASWSWHPTHEAALAHALAEVGLAVPEQHREAP